MGFVASSPGLPVAVAEAGGHGMVAAIVLQPSALAEVLDEVAAGTDGSWGVSFTVAIGADAERVELAAERAALVDFFWGKPDRELVERIHAGDAVAGWQVGSVEEAKAAEQAGCDVIVLQGEEAGGHVLGTAPLLELLEAARDGIGVPIVAAGGIGTRERADAAFDAGADAIRVGTRFIAAEEADAHPSYVDAVIAARPEDTTITKAFEVLWPDAQHRVLRSAIEAAEGLDDEVVGKIDLGGTAFEMSRFSAACPTRSATGSVEAMALYAGTSVEGVNRRQPAAEIVRDLVE